MKRWYFLPLLALTYFIDLPIAQAFQHKPEWLKPMGKICSIAISPTLWFTSICAAILLAYLIRYRRKEELLKGAFFLGLGYACIRALKNGIGRSRPKMWVVHKIHTCQFFTMDAHYHSFPSSHAFTAFFIILYLSKAFPKYRIPLFLLACLLTFSRIIVQQHFVTDLIAGALLAYAFHFLMNQKKIGQFLARSNQKN